MGMFPKFDDKAYSKGYEHCRKGGTFRSIVEPIIKEAETKEKFDLSRDDLRKKESAEFSSVIGFFDGFLDLVRKNKS